MARIRSIHPGLFTDEGFMSLSAGARIFFIGILTEADDNGVFERKPVVLRARIMPADPLDGEKLLKEIEAMDLIRTFSIDEKTLCAVKNFVKWQKPKSPKVVWDITDDIFKYVRADLREEDQTTAMRRRKCEDQGGKCVYCGTSITHYSKKINSLEIDHDTPVSRGGDDGEDNLVATCRTCNRSKGSLTGVEFREKISKRNTSIAQDERLRNSAKGNANYDFACQREEGGGKKEERKERTDASHLASAGAAPPDARAQLWTDGLATLRGLTGKPDGPSRAFLGRLLRDLRDDCPAALEILGQAADLRPGQPEAWLVAAAKARASPPNSPPPRTQRQAEFDANQARIAELLGHGKPDIFDGTTIDGMIQ